MDKPIIIAGPCVIESMEVLETVAEKLVQLRELYGLDIIFKSSADSFFVREWLAFPRQLDPCKEHLNLPLHLIQMNTFWLQQFLLHPTNPGYRL